MKFLLLSQILSIQHTWTYMCIYMHMYVYICSYTLYTYLFQCGQVRYPHHCCKSHPLPNSSTSSYDLHNTRTLHDTHTTYIRIRCLIPSHIFITRAPNFRHFITLDFTYTLTCVFHQYSTHTLYSFEISSFKEACAWFSYTYVVYENYDIISPQKLKAVQCIHAVHYIVHIQWPYHHIQVTCDIELYITIR